MKRLLSTRRTVALDEVDEYLEGWRRVQAAAETAGARAWLFRDARREDHFIEFVEWPADATPEQPEVDAVATARAELNTTFGAGRDDEWEEVTG